MTSFVSRVFCPAPSCGTRHERGRANNPQQARGFGHVAQHGVTITSWGCGLTSAISPPLLQHAAVLTRVECWMSVGPAGAFEQKPTVLPSAYPLTDCPMIISTC